MESQVPQAAQEDEPQEVPENEPEMEEISEDDWNELFNKGKFKKQDMNMMVMNFLIQQELPIVAAAFHKESGCPLGIDAEDLSKVGTQKIVRDLIICRQFDDAIRTLNETMTPVFFQLYPRLHFLLEQQKMIELCRRRDSDAVLSFSHKFVMWETFKCESDSFNFESECRSTLLLMSFGDDKESPPAALLDYRRIFWIANEVVESMVHYNGREKGNCIEKALKMMQWLETYELDQIMCPTLSLNSGYPKFYWRN